MGRLGSSLILTLCALEADNDLDEIRTGGELAVVTSACDLSTREVKPGGPRVQSQPLLGRQVQG